MEWKFADKTAYWGEPSNEKTHVNFNQKKVRSIKLSDSKCGNTYRIISFLDENNKQIDYFNLWSSFWPASYPETTLKIPDGYELIGYVLSLNERNNR